MTGALEWIEGPPDVWTAEIEDTCRYPDDDEPGAFLVSIRSDENGLRYMLVSHNTKMGAAKGAVLVAEHMVDTGAI